MARYFLIVPQFNGEYNLIQGGQKVAADSLIAFLRRNDHEVYVYNTVPPKYLRSSLFYKVIHSIFRSVLLPILVFRYKPNCVIAFKGGLASLFERLPALLISRMLGAKSYLFFRNTMIMNMNPKSLLGLVVGFVLRSPTGLLVQGKKLKVYLSELGLSSHKIKVVPNWLPKEFSVSQCPVKVDCNDVLRFVFVGRITENKGVYDIISALELISDDFDYELVMVGDGDALQSLKQQVAIRRLDFVSFTGWLDRHDLSSLLANCHVLVLPTRHDEGFPNSILEAMSVGLPVISTDVGAITDSIIHGENGLVIPTSSPQELANAMSFYLENRGCIANHSLNSLRTIRFKHDMEINCKIVMDLASDV